MQAGVQIVRLVRERIAPGTEIPKPVSEGGFTVEGWGTRRGEEALIYRIPNRKGGRPYLKGITVSELEAAWRELDASGELSHAWFRENLPACAAEGSCNFTTLGGIFELLKLARYGRSTRGQYLKVGS